MKGLTRTQSHEIDSTKRTTRTPYTTDRKHARKVLFTQRISVEPKDGLKSVRFCGRHVSLSQTSVCWYCNTTNNYSVPVLALWTNGSVLFYPYIFYLYWYFEARHNPFRMPYVLFLQ